LLGAALAVKPLLHVADGQIAPLAKARTAVKARARLLDLAVQAPGHRTGVR
jgi:fatty acid-binding protein DegV